jgi:hypothetical protein
LHVYFREQLYFLKVPYSIMTTQTAYRRHGKLLWIDIIEIDGIEIKIYNRDRTICDVLRYEKKLEKEVFYNAIGRYIEDSKKNIRKLFEYAEIFNIKNKVQTRIGMWL